MGKIEARVLDRFSLSDAHQAFTAALDAVERHPIKSPVCRLGDFGFGDPISIQFVFVGELTHDHFQVILATAAGLGMMMRPLRFETGELVFEVRTRVVVP